MQITAADIVHVCKNHIDDAIARIRRENPEASDTDLETITSFFDLMALSFTRAATGLQFATLLEFWRDFPDYDKSKPNAILNLGASIHIAMIQAQANSQAALECALSAYERVEDLSDKQAFLEYENAVLRNAIIAGEQLTNEELISKVFDRLCYENRGQEIAVKIVYENFVSILNSFTPKTINTTVGK